MELARNLFYKLQNIKFGKNSPINLIRYKTWHLTRSSGRLSISNSAPLNSSVCIQTRAPKRETSS